MIRLAAFDIDQTLLGDDLNPSPRVRQAIAGALQRGVIITLVTGRGPLFTGRIARQLGLNAPVVCYQGGMAYDFVAGQTLHEVRLSLDLLPAIVSAAREYDWNLHFEEFGHIYMPRRSNHPPIYYELMRYYEVSRVDDFLREVPAAPHKFLVTLNQPQERGRVIAEMQQNLDQWITIIPSHPYLVEGLPPGVNKGRGLAWLAEYFHLSPDEVLAVGDNDNDVPMLEWAGVGVAVGNASPAARLAADWIAPPLQEDGAAATIEKFILLDDILTH